MGRNNTGQQPHQQHNCAFRYHGRPWHQCHKGCRSSGRCWGFDIWFAVDSWEYLSLPTAAWDQIIDPPAISTVRCFFHWSLNLAIKGSPESLLRRRRKNIPPFKLKNFHDCFKPSVRFPSFPEPWNNYVVSILRILPYFLQCQWKIAKKIIPLFTKVFCVCAHLSCKPGS